MVAMSSTQKLFRATVIKKYRISSRISERTEIPTTNPHTKAETVLQRGEIQETQGFLWRENIGILFTTPHSNEFRFD